MISGDWCRVLRDETPPDLPPSRKRLGGILLLGIVTASSASLLIRSIFQATAGLGGDVSASGMSLLIAASRLTMASLLLLPQGRGIWNQGYSRRSIAYALAAGLCLALHFGAWITSLSYTSIAASTVLVTTNPLWVALLSWLWFGEKPAALGGAGIAIACLGGVLMIEPTAGGLTDGGAIAAVGSAPLLGNGLALLGAIGVSLYLLLGQAAQRQGLSTGHYVLIAYGSAALVLLPLPLFFGVSYLGHGPVVYGGLLALALGPQLIGHSSLNWAMRWVSPTVVSLVILAEPLLASVLGYWAFGERPGGRVALAAVVLLLGVVLVIVGQSRRR